ncbi:hypothetical protein ACX1DX_11905 [Tessaracoccus sp. Y36]
MMEVQEEILATVRKAGDLESRVRTIEVDGVKVVEMRDFIPSLGEYGRGYWIPADRGTLTTIAHALLQAATEAD